VLLGLARFPGFWSAGRALAATLLLAGLLAAALLVLAALAGVLRVLRILWILVHATLSSCPSPNSNSGRRTSQSKSSIYLNIAKHGLVQLATTLRVDVFNLSKKLRWNFSMPNTPPDDVSIVARPSGGHRRHRNKRKCLGYTSLYARSW
jgi:hypothetical protein